MRKRPEHKPPEDRRIKLMPYYGYYRPSQYLGHLQHELGRIGADPDTMRDTFAQPLRDLVHWVDDPMTEGMRLLYDYRALDFDAVSKRAPDEADRPPCRDCGHSAEAHQLALTARSCR